MDLIAIGHIQGFQAFSSSDLANCKCLGSTFFCDGWTVQQTNIVKDCLGSLFMASWTLIKDNCKFQIEETREKIFSLGNNTWLVYSGGTIATNHVCPKAGSLSPLTISSGQAITVQLGCHNQTMDHIVTADDSSDMEIHFTWLDWTMTLSQLFDHLYSEQINAIIKENRSKIAGEFDANKLLQQLDELKQPFKSDHWLYSSPAAMIGINLILSFVSFTIWKNCCAKSTTESTVTPNPSAPVAPLASQPATINLKKSAAPITIIYY